MDSGKALMNHILAVLAYRTDKAIQNAPSHFADFQAGAGVRTPEELLRHMTSVLIQTADRLSESESTPLEHLPFDGEVNRFRSSLRALSSAIETVPLRDGGLAERLIQGPLSDTMTHVGQLALLRRLAGSPLEPEDFFRASIGPENLVAHPSTQRGRMAP